MSETEPVEFWGQLRYLRADLDVRGDQLDLHIYQHL